MPSLNWSHLLIGAVLLFAGLYMGAKNPGLVSKVSLGTVSG